MSSRASLTLTDEQGPRPEASSGLSAGPLQLATALPPPAHLGEGNVLLFANNPIYRGETIGSYPLVFNAIMNFQYLAREAQAGVGVTAASPPSVPR